MAIINGVGRVGIRVTSGGSSGSSTVWNNLLSYYKGDNSPNDSKGSNHGDLINGTTYTTGKINNCFSFDGVNDYINIAATSTLNFGTNDFSYSCWINPSNVSGTKSIATFGSYYDTDKGFCIYAINDTIVVWRYSSTSGYVKVGETTGILSANNWQHLSIVRSGGNMYCYLNNTKYTLTSGGLSGVSLGNSGGINQLGRNSGGFYFSGKMDEIGVWNKALSDSEVTELYNSGNGLSYTTNTDADAQAFITAASLTDSTQISAVNTLVTGLKSAGLWSKMKAIYPFVGGNSTAHSKNLVNPSLYNLSFSNGVTHNSNGITPNGSSGFANTGFIPSTSANISDFAMGIYSRTNNAGNYSDIGCQSNGTAYQSYIFTKWSDNNNYSALFSDNFPISNNNSTGLFCVSRTSSTLQKSYKNNSVLGTSTATVTQLTTNPIAISAINRDGNTQTYFSNRNLSFSFISTGLSDSEISSLYTAVQAFQTTLGRQV